MGMSAVSGAHSSKPPPMPGDYDGLKHVIPDSITPQLDTRYTLRGKNGNDVRVPLLCWGAWSWGDTSTFHWSDDELPALRAAWKKCLENGLTFVDTAQVYGSGKSEEILADLIHNHSPGVDRSKIVKTKWLPNVTDQATNVLHPVDAPFKQLQKTLEQGLTKTVGVANYSVKDLLQMKEALAEYETEGMLEVCRENDIVFQSYSSIAQGRLSGKYNKDNPPPKEYRFSSYDMEHVEPCLEVQRGLAEKYKCLSHVGREGAGVDPTGVRPLANDFAILQAKKQLNSKNEAVNEALWQTGSQYRQHWYDNGFVYFCPLIP
ncbi:NADP-dependent oxidoreductase domain-containing protein [Xylaria acuta]|nr:NADP-dependent oxidoreductase domain-containing protein [Xylaria acuta]